MLRMGRTARVEPYEEERPQNSQPAPHAAPSQQPQQPTGQPAAAPRPAAPAPRAVSESDALARDLREGVMCGFLGGNSVVTGEADFKGMLRIDGRFTGHIRSEKGTLIVSAGGRVDADIKVATAKVNGVVNGDIVATERIELGRTAHVRGDISAPTLVVEQGAIFEGSCQMKQAAAAREEAQRQSAKEAEAARAQQAAPSKPAPAPAQAPVQAAPNAAPAVPQNAPAAAKVVPTQGSQPSHPA